MSTDGHGDANDGNRFWLLCVRRSRLAGNLTLPTEDQWKGRSRPPLNLRMMDSEFAWIASILLRKQSTSLLWAVDPTLYIEFEITNPNYEFLSVLFFGIVL